MGMNEAQLQQTSKAFQLKEEVNFREYFIEWLQTSSTHLGNHNA
jgi:hypothetical protein